MILLNMVLFQPILYSQVHDIKNAKPKMHLVPDSVIKKLVHRIEIERQLDSLKNEKIKNLLFSLNTSYQIIKDYSLKDSLKKIQIEILSDSLAYYDKRNLKLSTEVLVYRYSLLGILVILFLFLIF